MKDQVQQGIGLTEHKFSLKSTEFLRNLDIKGNMFNFFDLGGFIDWQLSPKKLAFIDGRGGKQFEEHQLVTGASKEIENIFEKYDITYIVTKTVDSSGTILPLIKYLTESPRWELVFADGLTVIYLKNIPENKNFIDKYRLPKRTIVLQIMQELFHYTYLGVNKLYVYSYIGNMYMESGDYANALRFFKMAYEINDDPRLGEFIHRLETMKRTM
jgi:tetratricopeptide (TPR) repeat protein